MSYFDLQQALLTKLVNSGIFSINDIAFENDAFDPSGKTIWCAINILPQTEESMGKSSSSSNDRRGVFQVSVYVEHDSDNFANDQLQKIDDVLSEFSYNSTQIFNGQTVQMLESNVTSGRTVDSWYVRDISINYLLFTAR